LRQMPLRANAAVRARWRQPFHRPSLTRPCRAPAHRPDRSGYRRDRPHWLWLHARPSTAVSTRPVRQILGRLRVGSSYVKCSMIDAVVGAQPWRGGLSGSCQVSGPRHLYRFATERIVWNDTTAAARQFHSVVAGGQDGDLARNRLPIKSCRKKCTILPYSYVTIIARRY
jgi:hypothetical protein